MKKEITGGKWQWSSENNNTQIDVFSENHGAICTIHHAGRNRQEHEANADLIVAAPKLKEALETLVNWVATMQPNEKPGYALSNAVELLEQI